MRKSWISVKCGLSRDPKHRLAMGESVWLFLHILDLAEWETGRVSAWKDESAADEMGMPIRTLREHRRKLDELGYITCVQKHYGQEIVIHNWTSPREYGGEVRNKRDKKEPQGDRIMEPQGDRIMEPQGSTQDVTPTSYSTFKNQKGDDDDGAFARYEKLYSLYQQNITPEVAPLMNKILANHAKTYPVEWYEPAFAIYLKNKGSQSSMSFEYIEKIWASWKEHGFGWSPKKNGNGAKPSASQEPRGAAAARKFLERHGVKT